MDTPITSVLSALNLDMASLNAIISVGQTKVLKRVIKKTFHHMLHLILILKIDTPVELYKKNSNNIDILN